MIVLYSTWFEIRYCFFVLLLFTTMPSCDDICVVCCRTRSHPFLCISSFFSFSISSCSPTRVNWSGEEQAVLMKANDEVDHHLRPVGAATDWRRSRSESSGAVDDLETSYVPAAACLPGPHRRHYVNISNQFVFLFFFFIPHIHLPTS